MNRWGYILLAMFGIVAAGIISWFSLNRADTEIDPDLEADFTEQSVQVFFPNNIKDPEMMDCSKVYPVTRSIEQTEQVARAALEELFKGPTSQEKTDGYFTSINAGVKIQKLTIENETAKVDFDEQLEFQVGGSCRTASIRSQIRETLEQFSTVKNVIISIDGRTEDILQP